jgi:hypothetical protein
LGWVIVFIKEFINISNIPWSRILLEKPLFTQMVKKFLFYGTQRFITIFTRAYLWPLS